jgi:hypothetical protein
MRIIALVADLLESRRITYAFTYGEVRQLAPGHRGARTPRAVATHEDDDADASDSQPAPYYFGACHRRQSRGRRAADSPGLRLRAAAGVPAAPTDRQPPPHCPHHTAHCSRERPHRRPHRRRRHGHGRRRGHRRLRGPLRNCRDTSGRPGGGIPTVSEPEAPRPGAENAGQAASKPQASRKQAASQLEHGNSCPAIAWSFNRSP